MVTAKYIETGLWNRIINLLIENKWEVTYEYDGMDAGIDFNSVTLKKEDEEIMFEWTNWEEGEIKCRTLLRLNEIEEMIGQKFKTVS